MAFEGRSTGAILHHLTHPGAAAVGPIGAVLLLIMILFTAFRLVVHGFTVFITHRYVPFLIILVYAFLFKDSIFNDETGSKKDTFRRRIGHPSGQLRDGGEMGGLLFFIISRFRLTDANAALVDRE